MKLVLVSNQMALAWATEQRGASFVHKNITIEPYGNEFWGCFRGVTHENGDIYVQGRVATDLVDYKSFVNKFQVKEEISRMFNPVVCLVGSKPYCVSFICSEAQSVLLSDKVLKELSLIDRRDNQRELLYKWEETYLAEHDANISIKKMHNLCDLIRQQENLDVLCLKGSKSKVFMGKAFFLKENTFIPAETVILMSHVTRITLIHELTHALVEKRYGCFASQAHGSIFVREYIKLLIKYTGLEETYLVKSALSKKLKIATERDTEKALLQNAELFSRVKADFNPRDNSPR